MDRLAQPFGAFMKGFLTPEFWTGSYNRNFLRQIMNLDLHPLFLADEQNVDICELDASFYVQAIHLERENFWKKGMVLDGAYDCFKLYCNI
jgi:hypothetical protein